MQHVHDSDHQLSWNDRVMFDSLDLSSLLYFGETAGLRW
jgi:hypothetical protein